MVVRIGITTAMAGVTWIVRELPLPTAAQGALMVLSGATMGDVGLRVARRVTPYSMLRRHRAAQTAIFAIVGTIYGLIAAFVVVVVWENFSDTDATVSREANALGDLEQMSRGFDVVIRRQVQEAARTYALQVVEDEWPEMQKGASSERAHAALIELWHVYTDMGPRQRQTPLYNHSVTRLNEIDDNRRLRLTASKERVPLIMWVMLYAGGLATIMLGLFFESPYDRFHRMMVTLLAGTVMFSIFLIASLEGPFDGDIKVESTAFQFVLKNMQNLER